MSVIVGIDLGTTNSCVALPGNADVPGLDALIEERRLRRVGDMLVITNRDRSPTTPSAVWVDQDGTVLVGMRAKSKARTSRLPPAMFFKRNMGTDQQVTAGHATLTPLEASAHVLRHLKALAEDVLKVTVERAVITVPAFFETRAKNETAQAGAMAGLDVVETLIEPVAAAMAYTRDIRGDLVKRQHFLIYDLGGGTFDTSVVSWDPELGFENLSFDGDRYLGGYDFDRRIVRWMRSELPEHDLAVDPDDPADMAVHASLLALAEEAKHELSRATFAEIVSQHCVDRRGELMNLSLVLERNEFEEMIGPQLRATLTRCDRSVQRARERVERDGGRLSDIDDVVMVGGSSRIPMVVDLLKEHFGRPPRSLHPDLCVAVGAALKAANAPIRSGVLELDRPEPTPLLTDVSGRVRAGVGGPLTDAAGVTVVLTSDDGVQRLRTTTDADGLFLFEDVRLREDSDSVFTVGVHLKDGREVGAERLVVQAGRDEPPAPSGDVLAHDFALQLKSGLRRVVFAGTKLPYRTAFQLETASQGTILEVRLFEGRVPIGKVEVGGLPAALPVGTPVEVTLEFQVGWTIRAEAAIPSIGTSASALLNIPPREVPDWQDLRFGYEEARTSWAERRDVMPRAKATRIGPEIDTLLFEIAMLLDEGHDRAQAHHKLLEAQTLVADTALTADNSDMQPPLSEFEAVLADITLLMEMLARRDPAKAKPFQATVPSLEAEGRAAYERGNLMGWVHANDALFDRVRALYDALPEMIPTPAQFQDVLLREISRLTRLLRDLRRLLAPAVADRIEADLNRAALEVSSVDPDRGEQARQELSMLYRNRVKPLRRSIDQHGARTADDEVILPDLPDGWLDE
ncbi:Hsp70 family protein [Frankia sp. Cr1]|uniref:Hsp70 family protein n=1 Tax=Frankia sp. Cr1 TaxID=3073931 RepID=UPI002AD48BFD|nr:Hsp70 family protein [Frankia sp. Cr1]